MKYPRPLWDFALLFLRILSGILLAVGHGWMKYEALVKGPEHFPDPLGIGHLPSLICALGAECFCTLMVAIGFYTRFFCIPIIFTMSVIAYLVHRNDTWLQTEPSVLYLLIYSYIAMVGPGRWNVQRYRAKPRA
jgi:putative oxidoreductase